MPLNKAKGNMYGFIDYTWNLIKGVCPHNCSYCYMRKWWPNMSAPKLDKKEFNVDPGDGKYIFVGSSIDMWAEDIPEEWIERVLKYCKCFDYTHMNTFLFQSKNPERFMLFEFPKKTILCTTIESNRWYRPQMGNTSQPNYRHGVFKYDLSKYKKMITIEPVMDFDLEIMLEWMTDINPIQINIGADSGRNNLPEPSKEKLTTFITALENYGLNVYKKPNLNRILS